MRCIDLDVFRAGEPDPYPPGTPTVRRRLRAVPADPTPLRTWLWPSVNGVRAWHRVYDRHHQAVVGHAWLRRSTLRWRRLAWSAWSLGLLASIALTLAAAGPGRPDPAPTFAIVVVVLVVAALLLLTTRVRAVLDPDTGQVGVRD